MSEGRSELRSVADAVIFLPGLGMEWTDKSVEKMGHRWAIAMERSAPAPWAFTAKLTPPQAYGVDHNVTVVTIERTDGEEPAPVLDLFAFDYRAELTARFRDRSLFAQAGRLLVMIPYAVAVLLSSFVADLVHRPRRAGSGSAQRIGTHPKRPREVIQLLIGVLGLLLFCAYAATVIYALIVTIVRLRTVNGDQEGSMAAAAVVVASAVGLSLPKIRQWITQAAIVYLSVTAYLGFGAQKELIAGKLETLLEHVVEASPRYRRIIVAGYSFGSIVALDTVFPRGRDAPRRASEIHTLVTIGSPFDMVRTFWRNYFDGRHCAHGKLRWINVYSPEDVLGSNFRNDALDADSTHGIRSSGSGACSQPATNISYNPTGATKVSIPGLFVLAGIRAHSIYWDDDPDAETCFTRVVEVLSGRQ